MNIAKKREACPMAATQDGSHFAATIALLSLSGGCKVMSPDDKQAFVEGKITMDMHCSARTSMVASLLLAWAALPASAHHSPSAFDLSGQISKTGTVEKWTWTNPHSWLYIRVEAADGSQEIWGFEMGSTGGMIREGWNAADIKPGDKVTVTGAPGRDGAHVALLQRVQLPSGRVLRNQLDKQTSPGTSAAPQDASAPPPGAAINAPSSR
jgi:hypothetical protein